MEYSIGDLVYYGNIRKDDHLCVILNRAMGYGWKCLTDETDLPNRIHQERVWHYHIGPISNLNLFYGDTNMCSHDCVTPYGKMFIKRKSIKHKLV